MGGRSPFAALFNGLNTTKPYLAMVSLQFGYAGMYIVSMVCLKHGMSNFILATYRHVVATIVIAPFAIVLERKIRPKMTLPVFLRIVALGFLEPVLDQNFYYLGMKLTTATYSSAFVNMLPAVTFILAMIFSWAGFFILQSFTLKKYPAELSLTAWICFMGMIEDAIVSLIMVRDLSAWKLGWDSRLLAASYSGIVNSGIAYYVQGVVIRQRGPVFVTSFSPLCMIITAILGAIILAEKIHLGSILGAIIIVTGLYTVVWGKSKDGENSETDVKCNGLQELPITGNAKSITDDDDINGPTKIVTIPVSNAPFTQGT
ncbi:WAT1-related protein [Gossypium australe]|uniref:WAT1-related protein n=1 Tax=Gossypium australe TaxID=47621 RepID=A0A5B6WST6_9ROSI|nr:WAT1-related protein [Gossypium australe]